LYTPKNAAAKDTPATAVSSPFGAVKEQDPGLYARTDAYKKLKGNDKEPLIAKSADHVDL